MTGCPWRAALLSLLALLASGGGLLAQITYPYNGVYDERDGHFALTGLTVHSATEAPRENVTVVLRRGKIVSLRPGGAVPAGAVEVPLTGRHLWPAFVEPYGDYGMPEVKAGGGGWGDPPQTESKTPGAFSWNQALRAETDAAALFRVDKKAAEKLRAAGYATVGVHHPDGISRGAGAVVSLGEGRENEEILRTKTAHHLSFKKGSSKQNYPTSIMGSVALLRQSYLDGDWYDGQDRETNLSIAAWNDLQDLPQIFEVDDWQNLLRADRLGDEFGIQYVFRGGGDEYQQLAAVRATGGALILPVKFPDAYDVSDPYAAELVTVGQLRHWERAPANVAAVQRAGIPFSITAQGHDKAAEFHAALRKTVEMGADAGAVLHALTVAPAELLGVGDRTGRLEAGYDANFFVTDKDLFREAATVYQTWVRGQRFELQSPEPEALTASAYVVRVGDTTYDGTLSGEAGSRKLALRPTTGSDTTARRVTLGESDGVLTLRFRNREDGGYYRLTATPDGAGGFVGTGYDPGGTATTVSLRPTENTAPAAPPTSEDTPAEAPEFAGKLTYPNLAYGYTAAPRPARVLFRNATVWTNEADGILEQTDVLIDGGKISRVGKNLPAGGAEVVDATGMHLTSGIIDEHSHIALSSVNESSESSTAEVRMMDAVDAVDENIYRQLAGGVTVSQLLHGSANPIGGQSAIVKLRWGKTAPEMLLDGADPFIKFALGENVKQSNWGDDYRTRYPQTRMGVEQIFESYFSRAREYADAPPAGKRRDLELETIREILDGERFISCHSYQQGEINMLMQVAERHGFRVNTFTHILEGYKVADKMAEHGVAGSTFSDWWAYKFEVDEAIPYNGAIMHENGVLTAFNSDDAEMARRLNQEAAKAVLFGGVSEEDAWKFVTLNPARMLHLDDRLGSIRAGKDADLVLWNNHPMSIYARAERTYVDGREYFNRERDAELRRELAAERNALIQASLDARAGGAKTQPAKGKRRRLLHCNSLDHIHTGHAH